MATNWHIEFEVTGKYLSDAQEAVHRLRGVTGIGVRPILESKPRKFSNGISLRDEITAALTTAGNKGMNGEDMVKALHARGIETNAKKASTNMGNMERNGFTRRVKPGTFVLTAKGKARAQATH